MGSKRTFMLTVMTLCACGQGTPETGVQAGALKSGPQRHCYSVRSLGTLGGEWSAPARINERGEMVGRSQLADLTTRAFFSNGGPLIDIGPPVPPRTVGVDINDHGVAVIALVQPHLGPLEEHVVVWRRGRSRDLGTLGGSSATPQRINERGQILGSVTIAPQVVRNFVWEHGTVTVLGTLDGSFEEAHDFNDRGVVVGIAGVGGQPHPFLWHDGKMRDLGLPDGTDGCNLVRVNNRNEVVGTCAATAQEARLYRWRAGRIEDLGRPGDSVELRGLNDHGQIIGTYVAPEHHVRAFVMGRGGRVTTIEPPGPSDAELVYDINDRGQVIGTYTSAIDDYYARKAFLWDEGVATELPELDESYGGYQPWYMNDQGQIVGTASIREIGVQETVFWEPGSCPKPCDER